VPGRWRLEALKGLKQSFPILRDPDLKLTRQIAARVTPETFVFDRNGSIAYRGAWRA
jgi:hypothetical protein